MTHHVLNPATNTFTADPYEIAHQVVHVGRHEIEPAAPEPQIILATHDEEDGIWLHPMQALAIAYRIIGLVEQSHDPHKWDGLVNGRTNVADIPDSAHPSPVDRSHLARAREDTE
jgi:hypothetical protein